MALWARDSIDENGFARIMHKLLEQVEVFSGFTPKELTSLIKNAELFSFVPGDTILAEGSEGNYLYVLLRGRVDITRIGLGGSSVEVAKLGPCDCFGEMSLTDHESRCANVRALGNCTLLRISERDCWRDPVLSAKLFRNISRILSQRLRAMNAMVIFTSIN